MDRFSFRSSSFRFLLFFLMVLALAGCTRLSRKAPYPHESVLTIIAELKIFISQDPYRQAPGQDLNGRNIFRVSLERLAALDALAGARQYSDVIAYARGECLERLGDWGGAAKAFAVAAQTSTSLAAPARKRTESATLMSRLLAPNPATRTLEGYLNDLDVQERRLREALASAPEWPYESYMREALEDTQEDRVRVLFINRQVLEGAVTRAITSARKLADEHPQSWRASDHQLLLGELYETMARDWTAQNRPDGPAPRLEEGWSGWIESAREAYRKVAQADGDPAKLEGQARLRALDAYALRAQALAK